MHGVGGSPAADAPVTVVGSVNLDRGLRVMALPRPGETVLGHPVPPGLGGKGANQAVAAARFGSPVRLVACVGSDADGAWLRAALTREGLDLSALMDVPGASGAATVLLDEHGENVIVVCPEANDALTPAMVAAALAQVSAGVLLLQNEIPPASVREALRVGREQGLRTVLNTAPSAAVDPLSVALIDVLVANEHEVSVAVGVSVEDLTHGVRPTGHDGAIVVTLGPLGAILSTADGVVRVPTPSVRAVDTVGAGDAFCGALAAALARGAELAAAVDIGCRAGALTVTRPGAVAALPTREEAAALVAVAAAG